MQVRRARLPFALPQVLAISAALQDRADLAYWLPAAEPSAGLHRAALTAPAANGAPAGGAQRSTGGESGDGPEPKPSPDRVHNAAEGATGEQHSADAAGSLSGSGAVGERTTADQEEEHRLRPDRSNHVGSVEGTPPLPKEHPWLPLALEVRLLFAKPRPV